MRVDVFSLFPGYFRGPFSESIIRRAIEKKLIDIHLHDIRDWAEGRHRAVDDRPFGGGPGMVLMPGPVVDALRSIKTEKSRTIYLSPQGAPLTAKKARDLASAEHLVLLAGHYEGIDQRALDLEVDEELSIGDYVLTNGCLPAIVLLDATVRFLPGVLGAGDGADNDSFESSLLDWPHYTKPRVFEELAVPEALLSGNHSKIQAWRELAAEKKTAESRPELYAAHRSRHLETPRALAGPRMLNFSLPVLNLRRARNFYSHLLGLEILSRDDSSLRFALGGVCLVLFRGQPTRAFAGSLELNLESVLERLEKALYPHRPVWKDDVLETIYLSDPNGHAWTLI